MIKSVAEAFTQHGNQETISNMARVSSSYIEDEEERFVFMVNSAILNDFLGYPRQATKIFLQFTGKNVPPEYFQDTPWLKAMYQLAPEYNQRLTEELNKSDYLGFFLRYSIINQDRDNIEVLVSHLERFNFSAAQWQEICRLTACSKEISLVERVCRAGLSKYPYDPELQKICSQPAQLIIP